jgi:glycosyltransferase involved in cell wall biosynthesis
MKILHVNASDRVGGAARAAYRIYRSQVHTGMDAAMRVLHKITDDPRVIDGHPGGSRRIARIRRVIRARLRRLPLHGFRTDNPILHSAAWLGTGLGRELDASDADVLNLHWMGNDTLSVAEIGRLHKPVVWTLHDMWAFCGAEHYADDGPQSRFRAGYERHNCPPAERAKDLNRVVWRSKRRHWRRPFHIVCPSRWLADCVSGSSLFASWPVHVVPYPLDLDLWRPLPKPVARSLMGLDPDARIVLVGAMGGLKDPRKGGDMALEALGRLAGRVSAPDALLVYGQSASVGDQAIPLPTTFLGPLHDDLSLVLAYSAADVFLMPSRQDNLPNTVIESLACGTPVVAFAIGGLPDMVTHRRNGWLARPFDIGDLADGIAWVLQQLEKDPALRRSARETALANFDEVSIAGRYRTIYEQCLS